MKQLLAIIFALTLCGFRHGSVPGNVPVVTNVTFNNSTTPATNAAVGTVSATNTPTSWSITACNPTCSTFFAIDNSGNITVTAIGNSNVTDTAAYTLTVQATNASGSGSGTVISNYWNDGALGASTGTVQHPNLLSTTVSAAANNGSGAIRLTVGTTTDFLTGQYKAISGVSSVSGPQQITVIDGTHVDLIGSTFASNTVSGGATIGEAVRGAWKVAGVDYAVGNDSGVSFTPWTSMVVTGCNVSVGGNKVTCTTAGQTISGIDFTTSGGAELDYNANNGIITNNKFLWSATLNASHGALISLGGTGITVSKNIIDGNGPTLGSNASSQTSLIENVAGSNVIEYNWLKNFNQHALENNFNGVYTYKYNLIENGGSGATGQHLNLSQQGGNTYTGINIQFNTAFNGANLISGGEGFQLYTNGGGTSSNNIWSYNTVLGAAGSSNNGAGCVVHISITSTGGAISSAGNYYGNYMNCQSLTGYFYPDPNACPKGTSSNIYGAACSSGNPSNIDSLRNQVITTTP